MERKLTLNFHNRRGITWPAELILIYQKELHSMWYLKLNVAKELLFSHENSQEKFYLANLGLLIPAIHSEGSIDFGECRRKMSSDHVVRRFWSLRYRLFITPFRSGSLQQEMQIYTWEYNHFKPNCSILLFMMRKAREETLIGIRNLFP
jgi:hypothetical protein